MDGLFDLLKWPAILAGVWWIVQKSVDWYGDRRTARRRELRDKIDEAKGLIKTIEADSHLYFTLAVSDPAEAALGRSILTNLRILAGRAHDIDCSLRGAGASQCCRILKQAMTLGDFQSSRRQVRLATDELLDAISDAARSFENMLERVFRAEFKDDTR
ncbi:MAG: hypothetical protein ACRD3W_30835 [Terriglobales bacterium]